LKISKEDINNNCSSHYYSSPSFYNNVKLLSLPTHTHSEDKEDEEEVRPSTLLLVEHTLRNFELLMMVTMVVAFVVTPNTPKARKRKKRKK
jgi:hypothetical protein